MIISFKLGVRAQQPGTRTSERSFNAKDVGASQAFEQLLICLKFKQI